MSCFVNEKCGFVNSTVLDTPLGEVVVCHPIYDGMFCHVTVRDVVPFWDSVNRKPVSGTRYRFGIESRFVTPYAFPATLSFPIPL